MNSNDLCKNCGHKRKDHSGLTGHCLKFKKERHDNGFAIYECNCRKFIEDNNIE